MKTVGTMLKEARLARHLTYDEVEANTKIRAKFLEAIERDDFRSLPSLSYAKGFVKNYAEYLGLPSDEAMAFFRRQTTDPSKASLLPKSVAPQLSSSPLRLTPARFLGLIISLFVMLFFAYFGLQYRALTRSPQLVVEQPQDKTISSQKRIDVAGHTSPDATVTVNGVGVLVRSDGKFFDQVTLEDGVNTITIIATSRLGKTTTDVREVGFQPLTGE
jgi:cytoskeletal protein RodZ